MSYCVIIHVFALFQNKPLLTIFEGNLFVSHTVAQTETSSRLIFFYWPYLLNDSAHGNKILLMERDNKFKFKVTNK